MSIRNIVARSMVPFKTTALILTLTLTSLLPMLSYSSKAYADSVVQAGNTWLSGGGVDIMSGGDESHNCVAVSDAPAQSQCSNITGKVYAGDKWQCVEMVNRLYLAKGWTTTTLWGNGSSIINDVHNHPSLSTELQGHISYVNPGDIVTETYGSDGHAGIIDSVDANGTIHIKSQNADLNSQASLQSGTSFAAGTASYLLSGWTGYAVQAIIHHPGSGSTPAHDLTQFYVGSNGWTNFDVSNAINGVKISGNPFEDSNGGVWARDSNSHLRQFYVNNGSWTAFDVTNAVGGVSISGDPYVINNAVFARDTNNHLRQFYVANGSWTAFDVSSAAGNVAIQGTPLADTNGGVWARDTNNHLRQFYVSNGSWTAFDVSNATGVNIASNVAAANGAEFARDTNNHLRQFYVANGSWTAFDVSSAAGVNVGANPIADSNGTIWIDDTASHLRQFYVSNNSWIGFDVTYAAGNITIMGDPGVSAAGTFATDSSGHLRQFYVANGSWTTADISSATGVNIASNATSGTSGEFAGAQ